MIFRGIKQVLNEFRTRLLRDDIKDVPVESGQNENGFYRVWKSGYKEMWGEYVSNSAIKDLRATITFPIRFSSIHYNVQISPTLPPESSSSVDYVGGSSIKKISESQFWGRVFGAGSVDKFTRFMWTANGF